MVNRMLGRGARPWFSCFVQLLKVRLGVRQQQGFSVYPKVPKEEKSSHCLLEEEELQTPKKARNDLDVPYHI